MNFGFFLNIVDYFRKSCLFNDLATWHGIVELLNFLLFRPPQNRIQIPKCIPLATKRRLSIFIIEFFLPNQTCDFQRMTIIHLGELFLLSLLTKVCVWWKRSFPKMSVRNLTMKIHAVALKIRSKSESEKGLGKLAIKAFLPCTIRIWGSWRSNKDRTSVVLNN